jgi:hypothetical protein
VFIPHAFYAQGQIVQLFDEITHEPAPQAPQVYDRRWVCSKRPVVIVGGELTLGALELSANPQAGFFDSPVQLKANNGVLIIDDFGRQRLTVRDLLNRWIVPLETGQEHLSFPTGQKITVPFDELVIFCTNIEPRELVDEAFLRRIRHKIKLGHISPVAFFQILKLNCERNFIRYDQRTAEYLIESYYQKTRRPICAAHARDIVDHIIDYARYRRTEPVFSKEVVDVACSTYFVEGY